MQTRTATMAIAILFLILLLPGKARAEVVDSVWKHFLVDQFKPYMEQGKHRKAQ